MTAPIFVTVENVLHNADGSVTIFGRDQADDPVVHTFPARSVVTVIRRGAK